MYFGKPSLYGKFYPGSSHETPWVQHCHSRMYAPPLRGGVLTDCGLRFINKEEYMTDAVTAPHTNGSLLTVCLAAAERGRVEPVLGSVSTQMSSLTSTTGLSGRGTR